VFSIARCCNQVEHNRMLAVFACAVGVQVAALTPPSTPSLPALEMINTRSESVQLNALQPPRNHKPWNGKLRRVVAIHPIGGASFNFWKMFVPIGGSGSREMCVFETYFRF
jgi:hypothetical protein